MKLMDDKMIIITGALGDTFLTTSFKTYRTKWKNKWIDKISNRFQNKASLFFKHLRRRGAHWQAIYHGILRESTNIPNYSAYHGKYVLEVLSQTDLEKVKSKDIRPKIGNFIIGKKVIYPDSNPSPAPWKNRIKFSSLDLFLDIYKREIDNHSNK